jgi:hypothetical protein
MESALLFSVMSEKSENMCVRVKYLMIQRYIDDGNKQNCLNIRFFATKL